MASNSAAARSASAAYGGSAAVENHSACPPMRGQLCEDVMQLIMDHHGRAPLGMSNEAYYSGRHGQGHIKAVVDALADDIETVYDAEPSRSLSLSLKRTTATMASLMNKRVHATIRIDGVCYPRCFVQGLSRNGNGLKVKNTIWKGKWIKLNALESVLVDFAY